MFLIKKVCIKVYKLVVVFMGYIKFLCRFYTMEVQKAVCPSDTCTTGILCNKNGFIVYTHLVCRSVGPCAVLTSGFSDRIEHDLVHLVQTMIVV